MRCFAPFNDDQLARAHLNAGHPDTSAWLRHEVDYLNDFVVNASLADETRPRFSSVGDGVLLIFLGVNLNENASPGDMVSNRLWFNPHRIILLQRWKLKAIDDLTANIEAGQGPVDCAGFIPMLICLILTKQLFTALIESFLQTLLIVIGVSIVLI